MKRLVRYLNVVRIGLLLTCILGQNPLKAQWAVSDKEDVEIVRSLPLAVVIMEPDQKVVDKLSKKKPDEAEGYKASIKDFNSYLKEVIESDWRYSKDVKFVTQAEAEEIGSKKDSRYAVLRMESMPNYKMGDFYPIDRSMANHNPSAANMAMNPSARSYHFRAAEKFYILSLGSTIRGRGMIARANMPTLGMTYTSVKFMVQFIMHQLDDCVNKGISKYGEMKDGIESRHSLLQGKTLFMASDLIGKPLQKDIDSGTFSKLYSSTTEVGDLERLDDIVKDGNQQYCYLLAIPSGAQTAGAVLNQYVVVDAKDGRLIFLNEKTDARAPGQFTEYHLKAIDKARSKTVQ
jgi:hypothetical protein